MTELRIKRDDWRPCSDWMCAAAYLNAFVVAWKFCKFLLYFVNFSVDSLDLHFEVNLTATCHKLERKWEELSWEAALISYSVGYLERMACGNHLQHAFALFLICCLWPFGLLHAVSSCDGYINFGWIMLMQLGLKHWIWCCSVGLIDSNQCIDMEDALDCFGTQD